MSSKGIRLAKAGEFLAWIGVAAFTPIVLFVCSSAQRFERWITEKQYPGIVMTIDQRAWIEGSLVMLLALSLLNWILVELALLFRAFRHSPLLGSEIERRLSGLSRAICIFAVAGFIQRPLLIAITTRGNPPGQSQLDLTLTTNHLLAILIAIFLVLFVHLFREARRADEENRGFI